VGGSPLAVGAERRPTLLAIGIARESGRPGRLDFGAAGMRRVEAGEVAIVIDAERETLDVVARR